MQKAIRRFALFAGFLILCAAIFLMRPAPGDRGSALYQVSTIGALMQGDYDGEVTVGTLKAHGDLGIGTFDGLDGEMVGLDGVVYQVKADGSVVAANDRVRTPFAMTAFFEADTTVAVTRPMSHEKLRAVIDRLAANKNIPYAVRIEGVFSGVRVRSVPRQGKPYRQLAEVVKEQSVFHCNDGEGVIVGFSMPGYMEGLNVPGSHLHFLSADRRAGGHLLDGTLVSGAIMVAPLYRFGMVLPRGGAFSRLDLTAALRQDIEKVEKDK